MGPKVYINKAEKDFASVEGEGRERERERKEKTPFVMIKTQKTVD